MPKIQYEKTNFKKKSRVLIAYCNEILDDYSEQGFDLTLRQLYYQLVSKNVIENNDKSYANLGNLVSSARRAGLIDWNHIVDRVRNIRSAPNWSHPSDILDSCADQFHTDWWRDQGNRVELWVEKEALIGVIGKVGKKFDVPYFTTKGYNSDSEMWSAARRFKTYQTQKQQPVVIYLGDHDPSGVQMTEDIENRLHMFGCDAIVSRVALNYDQVQELNLPENPAKQTDKRFASYVAEFGTESSWELDALPPSTIVQLLEDEVGLYVDDPDSYESARLEEKEGRGTLSEISGRYSDVVAYLSEERG